MIIQVNRIRVALREIASRKHFTRSDPPYLLQLTRQLLESQHLQRSFPVVNLYCNWCLHCTISKSSLGFEILRQITESLTRDIAEGTMSIANATEGVNAALRFGELRNQLISLFTKFEIDTWFFENTNFVRFMSAILDAIEKHPISFPKKMGRKAERAYSEIERIAENDPMRMIVRLLVTKDIPPEQLEFWGVPRGSYAWEAVTASEVTITSVLFGPVQNTAQPDQHLTEDDGDADDADRIQD